MPDALIIALGPIAFIGSIFAVVSLLVCGLHTTEGRAKWRHERRLSRDAARYIDMGMRPEDARAAANIDAMRQSKEILDALTEANGPIPSPRIRAVR